MISIVWAGDKAITQPWGITDVAVEPWFDLPGGPVHWHTGIDIGVYFAPLNAARVGRVAYVGYGLLCIQVGGELDWYVHIDHSDVVVGADVARGQHIAVSGDKVPSGGSLYGAHLHFETRSGPLWLGGELNLNIPTGNDPVPVLSGAYSGSGGSLTPISAAPRRPTMILATKDWLVLGGRGTDNALWILRWAADTGWASGWKSLGGTLSTPDITATNRADHVDLFGIASDGGVDHIWSEDGGATWSAWEAHGGKLNGSLFALSATPGRDAEILAAIAGIQPGAAPDLAPFLAALAAEHDAVTALATAIGAGDADLDTALGNLSAAVADVKTHVAHLT